ncbi:hypothetical protein AOQ84DRAFT_65227 [Glonium stellatum]|uniref:Uncharacterized protein n=1 Tax=Glonium stellatum TaxID=574774 RepID=A0A8E2EYM9_9PEZI|nr:hypothetical protein AOQ84DRAFT_65227 [Glonium stellatum]
MSPPEPNAAIPPRIPKLAVRARALVDQDSISTSSSAEPKKSEDGTVASSSKTLDAISLISAPSTSSDPPTIPDRRSSVSQTSTQDASRGTPTKGQKKKKGNSMFGFLTLKEPSQSALEHFAEHQRKQAAEKGGNMGAVGIPGVSMQKLPPTVPKVNSKWDGIPESLKAKEAAQKKRESFLNSEKPKLKSIGSPDGSVVTFESSGSRNPPNSIASSSDLSSRSARRPSHSTSTSSEGGQPKGKSKRFISPPAFDPSAAGLKTRTSLKSPSMTSLPEISYFFPDEPGASTTNTEAKPSGVSPPASSDLLQRPSNPKDAKRAPRPTSLQMSDNLDDIAWARSPTLVEFQTGHDGVDTQAVLKRISNVHQGFLAGEAQEMRLPGEEEEKEEDEVSELEVDQQGTISITSRTRPTSYGGHPVTPTTTNFSRPLSYHPSIEPLTSPLSPTTVSTLHSTSLKTPTIPEAPATDCATSNVSPTRRNMHLRNVSTDDTISIAGSVATSVAPSEMSAQWFRSPRERLGLGGRIKKNDTLPWENDNDGDELGSSQGKKKKGRLSMFVKGAS